MEGCNGKVPPATKDSEDNAGKIPLLTGEQASKVRRGIARVNYMAQDRPDLLRHRRNPFSAQSHPYRGGRVMSEACHPIPILKSQGG